MTQDEIKSSLLNAAQSLGSKDAGLSASAIVKINTILDTENPDLSDSFYSLEMYSAMTRKMEVCSSVGCMLISAAGYTGDHALFDKLVARGCCPSSNIDKLVSITASNVFYSQLKTFAANPDSYLSRDSRALVNAVRKRNIGMVQKILAHSCPACAPGVSVSQNLVDESTRVNGPTHEITNLLQNRLDS